MPTPDRRLDLRGSAGVNQSATVAGLVSAILVITIGVATFGPQVGAAVAANWICHLMPGATCAPADPAPRGRGLLEDDTARPEAPWTEPGYDAATFTGPGPASRPATSKAGGTWQVDGTPVSMDWCGTGVSRTPSTLPGHYGPASHVTISTTYQDCVDPDGRLRSCVDATVTNVVLFVPVSSTRTRTCDSTSTPRDEMTCVAAGDSPPVSTCQLRRNDPSGRIFRCHQDPATPSALVCTDNNHDATTTMAGAPVSCAASITQGLPNDLGTPCMSTDGTLYRCLDDDATSGGTLQSSCTSRALRPGSPGIAGCEEVGDGGVQCRYTGVSPTCTDTPQCPLQTTTVQCLVSSTDGNYNNCRDLGLDAGTGAGVSNVCVRAADNACTQVVPIPLEAAGTAPPLASVQVGQVQVQVTPDTPPIDIPSGPGGASRSADFAAVESWCTTAPEACATQVDHRLTTLRQHVDDLLVQTGFCADAADCDTQLAALTASTWSRPGRCLQATICGFTTPTLTLRTKKFLAVAGFVAAATGVQFAGTSIVGSLVNGEPIHWAGVGAVGGLAAITGGAILATVSLISGHYDNQIAAENTAQGQAATLEAAEQGEALITAAAQSPQVVAGLTDTAQQQPAPAAGAAAAQTAGVSIEMANLAAAAAAATGATNHPPQDEPAAGPSGTCPVTPPSPSQLPPPPAAWLSVGLAFAGGCA